MEAKLRQAERSFEMQPSTMRAVLLTGHGGYDKLDYRTDVPVPKLRSGEIKPLVAQTFALAEIEQAQETFLKKAHIGKIVLKVR